jgi:hypothetical protein
MAYYISGRCERRSSREKPVVAMVKRGELAGI